MKGISLEIVIVFIIILVIVISFIIYHDYSIDAEMMAEHRTCNELNYFIVHEEKKIFQNPFTSSFKKVYNERNCTETIP